VGGVVGWLPGLEPELKDVEFITVGYRLDPTCSELKDVHLVHHDSGRLCWSEEITDLAAVTAESVHILGDDEAPAQAKLRLVEGADDERIAVE